LIKDDLIFHIVSRRKWKEWQQNGFFVPPGRKEEDGLIRCLSAADVSEELNSEFAGRKHILLLVINCSRLRSTVRYLEVDGKEHPFVEGGINLDAVIDKIQLSPNENGRFDLEIETG